MVLADETLFVAGPPDATDEGTPKAFVLANPLSEKALAEALDSWRGARGALLWAVSAEDGRRLSAHKLQSPPVWDGMAATENRLFVSLRNGCVQWLGRPIAGAETRALNALRKPLEGREAKVPRARGGFLQTVASSGPKWHDWA